MSIFAFFHSTHDLHPVSYTHLTYPKLPDNQPLSIVNYDDDRRRPVADGSLMAWGELTYAKPLTEKQMAVSYTHLLSHKNTSLHM